MWARRVTPTRRATRGIVHSRQGQETGYDGALAFALPLLGNSWGRGVTSIADSSLIGICRQGPRCGRRFPCHWYDLVRLHSAGLLVAAFTNQQIAEGVSAPEEHIPWTKGCIRLRDGLQSYHCRPPADCTGGDTLPEPNYEVFQNHAPSHCSTVSPTRMERRCERRHVSRVPSRPERPPHNETRAQGDCI